MPPPVAPSRRERTYTFMLVLALVAIAIFFAALTSAYLVARGQRNWLSFELPVVFWFTTTAIVISSLLLHHGYRLLRRGDVAMAANMVWLTAFLGFLFLIGQYVGWRQLMAQGIVLQGSVSEGFFYVLSGLHAAHVLGGLMALVWLAWRLWRRRLGPTDYLPYKLVAIYWHFVGVLWIYLFVFFLVTL